MTPKYTEYAHDVLSGKITAGLYVRQACQRFLDWLDREDMFFDAERVDRVIRFIGNFQHYKGRNAGEPFILSDWQQFIIANIYGFYWRSNPQKRVVRNAYIECARKQGKSMLIAALSLYALLADGEPSPEVYIVANSAKQAGNLFSMSRTLASQLDRNCKFIRQYRDSLVFHTNKGVLKAMAFNPAAADSFGASFVVTDEYHSAPNSRMYDIMKSSQLQRLNPLNIVITTAGHNLMSPCYEMRNVCVEILSGLKTDDTQFAAIFELDDGDQWDNPTVWAKSNPNLHITVEPDDIAAEVQRAKNNASVAAEVKTKTLNIWLQSASTWLHTDVVNRSTVNVDLNDYRGMTVYIGIDLAAVSDLTAVSLLIPTADRYVFKTWYFVPQSALTDGVNAELYKRLEREQCLIVTAGNVTDYDYILSLILRLQSEYSLYIASVYFDSWNSTQFAIDSTDAGLNMQPFSQTIGNYNRPTKEFERLMLSGKITLDNNIITRWCIANVALKTDHNDNCKPVKSGNPANKIDGVIAMLTALGGYLTETHYDNTITV